MAWTTPKTDWYGVTNPSDGVYTGDRFNAVDFNRIKNNLTYLRELALKMYDESPSVLTVPIRITSMLMKSISLRKI